MSTEQEVKDVFLNIVNTMKYMDPVLKLTTLGGVMLFQYFARMVKEKKLNAGEFVDFQSFIKATDGQYDIMNIPAVEEEQLKEELRSLGVHSMVLPDLNKEDGMIQVAVYQPDRDKFGAWYERYLRNQMQGGEKALQELKNLTADKTSIVSFPLEGQEMALGEDFDSMGINYARLPDLNVGDGSIQIVIANSDMPKVEQWYRLKRGDLLKDGVVLPDYDTVTMQQYQETGHQSEENYIENASPEYQEANAKYEGKEKGELEQTVEEQQHKIRSETAASFESYANDPDYIPLSINHKTLVENTSLANPEGLRKWNQFSCRIPGTWGEKEKQVIIPVDQVFQLDGGTDYIAFLKKDKAPLVVDATSGTIDTTIRKMTGTEFAKPYFDEVEKQDLTLKKGETLKKDKVVTVKGKEIEKLKQPAPPIKVRL